MTTTSPDWADEIAAQIVPRGIAEIIGAGPTNLLRGRAAQCLREARTLGAEEMRERAAGVAVIEAAERSGEQQQFKARSASETGAKCFHLGGEGSIWNENNRRLAERAKKLPDERAAIDAMFEAFDRLRELGWSEAIYCPKDGSSFEVIEPGSTGIFRCHYRGEWPKGTWWIEDGGDLCPSRPILFRLFPEDEAKRKARMEEARATYARVTP